MVNHGEYKSCAIIQDLIVSSAIVRVTSIRKCRREPHLSITRSGRSVAEVVRNAIRKVVLRPQAAGPVAIWDGEPKRTSIDHDSVHDQP